MNDYRNGYEYYKQVSQQFGVEPMNFHYYVMNLTEDQLDAYNARAEQKRGLNEYKN